MNERIKELAHKAEFINKKHNGDEWRWGYIDPELSAKLEKFAELIVKECMAQCDKVEHDDELSNHEGGFRDGALLCYQEIREHFGVEE